MVGRLYELCSARCPVERPCTPEMSEAARAAWDAAALPAATPPPPPDPSKWPLLARLVYRLRVPADRGLGDTLARHLDYFGGGAFKRLYRQLTGRECGCGDRQAALNALFAYPAP